MKIQQTTNEQRASGSSAEFRSLSSEQPPSIVSELAAFILENKKWWLIPIMLVLGLVSLLVLFGSTGAAPFIYTLF